MTKKKDTTGYLFRRPNSSQWYIQYQVAGKRFCKSLRTANRRDAEEKAAVELAPYRKADEAEALRATKARLEAVEESVAVLTDQRNPPLSFLKAWQAYVESETRPQSGPLTMAQYEGHWGAFFDWLKEHSPAVVYLREVTPDMAAGFIRHLGKQHYSGNRINKFARFLKTFFRVLAKPARMTTNPFDEIASRKHLPESKRPFTIEELKLILETAEGELRTLFYIGTFTGLRLADAATLQWGEVDLQRGIIRRIPRKTARTGQAVIIGIPAVLSEYLAAIKRCGRFVVPTIATEYAENCPALSRRIQAHLIKCGIQTVKPGTGFEIVQGKDGKPEERSTGKRAVVLAGFHSLRHTFISLHAQAGTSQAVMQKLAGHGNPMMTEHYTHISDATARQSADAFPHIMGAEPVKALPPVDWQAKVRELAGKLNGKTWRNVKAELERLAEAGV